jgi:hypothetical protein
MGVTHGQYDLHRRSCLNPFQRGRMDHLLRGHLLLAGLPLPAPADVAAARRALALLRSDPAGVDGADSADDDRASPAAEGDGDDVAATGGVGAGAPALMAPPQQASPDSSEFGSADQQLAAWATTGLLGGPLAGPLSYGGSLHGASAEPAHDGGTDGGDDGASSAPRPRRHSSRRGDAASSHASAARAAAGGVDDAAAAHRRGLPVTSQAAALEPQPPLQLGAAAHQQTWPDARFTARLLHVHGLLR